MTLELFFPFRNNREHGLRITYSDVTDFSLEVTAPHGRWSSPGVRRLGSFQFDEALPHATGCRHEIQMIGGVITVIAADLMAEWIGG